MFKQLTFKSSKCMYNNLTILCINNKNSTFSCNSLSTSPFHIWSQNQLFQVDMTCMWQQSTQFNAHACENDQHSQVDNIHVTKKSTNTCQSLMHVQAQWKLSSCQSYTLRKKMTNTSKITHACCWFHFSHKHKLSCICTIIQFSHKYKHKYNKHKNMYLYIRA